MAESQNDIDTLLAEVNALAEEAVASIASSESLAPPAPVAVAVAPRPAAPRPAPRTASPPVFRREAPSPAPAQQSISRSVKTGRIPSYGVAPSEQTVSHILNIEVPIIVQLSQRTMPLSEILNLTSGSIIEFDKPADGELELRVNNKCIGTGQAVKVGENFGLRVVRIGSLRERIHALGSK